MQFVRIMAQMRRNVQSPPLRGIEMVLRRLQVMISVMRVYAVTVLLVNFL